MSRLINYPEPLDDAGNIFIHVDTGFAGFPFVVRERGVVQNIAASALFFEIPAIGHRVALAAHPSDALSRAVPAISKAICQTIPDGAHYVIVDETGGGSADLFSGQVRRWKP